MPWREWIKNKIFNAEKELLLEEKMVNSCLDISKEASETLNRLTVLTEALDFGNVGHTFSRQPEYKEIHGKEGYIFQFGIHKSGGIGVSKLFLSKNAITNVSCLGKLSILVVWHGAVEVFDSQTNDLIKTLENPASFELSGEKYKIKAVEESWVLAIAVPPPSTWPAGPYTHRSRRTKKE